MKQLPTAAGIRRRRVVQAAAGASLVQLYSALVFQGPGLVARIKRELLQCLERDGFANVTAAVGTGAS